MGMIDFAAASDQATPGLVRSRLGDWNLRGGAGATGRANSTTAHGDPGIAIGEAVDRVEAFYEQRDVPATFQVWDETPAAVIAELDQRTYTQEPTTEVMAAPLDAVLGRLSHPRLAVRVDDTVPEAFARSLAAERLREVTNTGLRARFGVAFDRETDLGVGMAVLDPPLVGLFSIKTLADRQGQGAGGAVVRALLDGLAGEHCHTVWLQVETDNTRALGWYQRLGFTTRTRYRYRTSRFTSGSPSGRGQDTAAEPDSES